MRSGTFATNLAEAFILGRLIAPDSYLGTWRWLRSLANLPVSFASDPEKAGKDVAYEVADHLWRNRPTLETALRKQENALYPLGEIIVLYYPTNARSEGRCQKNPLAKRSHSNQMRSDCPLVSPALALAVDTQGFPLFSQICGGTNPTRRPWPRSLCGSKRTEATCSTVTGQPWSWTVESPPLTRSGTATRSASGSKS